MLISEVILGVPKGFGFFFYFIFKHYPQKAIINDNSVLFAADGTNVLVTHTAKKSTSAQPNDQFHILHNRFQIMLQN